MKALALILLLTAPALADESRTSFFIAPGAAWTLPFTKGLPDYEGLRQDVTLSLLGQVESRRWLAQAEAAFGGLSAKNPTFKLFSGRVGGFVVRGNPDVSISAGAGYMTYKADSTSECPQFGCDKFVGSGPALVAEIAVRFTVATPIRGGLFFSGVLPLFDVTQNDYIPAVTRTRAIGTASIGLRLYL